MAMKPITPAEALNGKHIPDAVIQAFNVAIQEAFNPNSRAATVYQPDILRRLAANGMTRADVLARGWLNIEGVFQAAGWDVTYDKPGLGESYDAYWRFQAAK